MTPYKLGDVLGGMLSAVTEAQYISDLYTDSLYKVYMNTKNELDTLAIPNTEFVKVQLQMSFAVAEVKVAGPLSNQSPVENPPPPQVMVYVNAADLSEIPNKDISQLTIDLKVENMEALPSGGDDDLLSIAKL